MQPRALTIVTWNMGAVPASAYRKTHERAWTHLCDSLRPDVAFVQEARIPAPSSVRVTGQMHAVASWPDADWGCGVWARTAGIVPVELRSEGVYLAAASLDGVVLVSVHVRPVEQQRTHLEKLVEVLHRTLDGRLAVIAGDFNAARRWDEVYERNDYTWFFERMSEAGFHDAHRGLHGKEVQTFWGPKAKEAYQDDHVFVTRDLAARVVSCDVIDDATVRELSDHAPVRLVLRLAEGQE